MHTPGEEIGADEIAAVALSEVVEDSIAVRLAHLRVDVVAAVADLRDLLRQQLHALSRVAEDDRLIDAQLKLSHSRLEKNFPINLDLKCFRNKFGKLQNISKNPKFYSFSLYLPCGRGC